MTYVLKVVIKARIKVALNVEEIGSFCQPLSVIDTENHAPFLLFFNVMNVDATIRAKIDLFQ